MNPTLVHLVVVHLPVVGGLGALLLLSLAMLWRDRRLELLAFGLMVVCAVASAVAYFSGPGAFDHLEGQGFFDQGGRLHAEDHALWGRGVFLGNVLLGLGAVIAWVNHLQGQPPSPWLRRSLWLGLLLLVVALAWTAHQGGLIRRPEFRS